jgi:hypothetical protein
MAKSAEQSSADRRVPSDRKASYFSHLHSMYQRVRREEDDNESIRAQAVQEEEKNNSQEDEGDGQGGDELKIAALPRRRRKSELLKQSIFGALNAQRQARTLIGDLAANLVPHYNVFDCGASDGQATSYYAGDGARFADAERQVPAVFPLLAL